MKRNLKQKNIIEILVLIAVVVIVNGLSSLSYKRIDLTSDNRYTLTDITISTLESIEEVVYVQVYLEGEMPVGFARFKTAIHELLDEYKVYARRNVMFEFIDPYDAGDKKEQQALFKDLSEMGLEPVNIRMKEDKGNFSQKIVFPGAVVNYKGQKTVVNLLRNNPALNSEQNLDHSIEGIEYEFTSAIKKIIKVEFPFIAFVEGHGELDEYQTADITRELSEFYNIDRVVINGQNDILDQYDAIIIAKPTKAFSEADKYVIDQYVMQGGKVLWAIDKIHASMDSLSKGNTTLGLIHDLNIDDQLFKYHVRVNPVFVQDIQCVNIPVNMALAGQQPKWVPTPWIYSPILAPPAENPITKGLNMIKSEFLNSVDMVGDNDLVTGTVLLTTSPYSKTVQAPVLISLGDINKMPDESSFTAGQVPVAVLMEGTFESVYKNRIIKDFTKKTPERKYKETSTQTEMIVIADGDIMRNDVNYTPKGIMIRPLGIDKYTNKTYGNRQFVKNCVNYLCGEKELMQMRSRDFKIRMLDRTQATKKRIKWQLINVLLPLVLIVFAGFIFYFIRKKKYAA